MKNVYKINWSNGMLIDRHHMYGIYEYIDYQSLLNQYMIYGNDLSFGLISLDNEHEALELRLENEVLKLIRLSALIKSGKHINYHETEYKVSLPISQIPNLNSIELHVISASLTEEEVFFGEVDNQEFPPRLPFVTPKINLTSIPWNEYKKFGYESNYLALGVLKNENGTYSLSSQYIPPCINVRAHPLLATKFKSYHNQLFEIYQFALHSSQIARDSLIGGRENNLAQGLQFISERLSDYISNTIDSYKLNGSVLPTWEWYLIFKKLGRNLLNSFTTLKSIESQDVKNYIHQWCGVKPNDLTSCIQVIIEEEYNPKLINQSIQNIDNLMDTVHTVFNGLKNLREFEKTNTLPYKEAAYKVEKSIQAEETVNNLPFKL